MFDKTIFKKPNNNVVKATMNEFRGQIYIHLREYQMDGDTGHWFPTKNGYAFIAEEIDSVIDKLQQASELFAKHSRNKDMKDIQLEFNFEENNI